jgi:cytidyltransferase-like protein
VEKAINITHERLIESWVADILRQYERATKRPVPLPIPILDIAERLFALRCDVENLGGRLVGASGALIPRKRWMILNRHQCSGRLAFTLAHELAHWLIDGQELQQGTHGLEHITGLRSSNARIREKRAQHVAGSLLMPKYIMLNEIRRLQMAGGATLSDLSDTFGVSHRAMVVRLEELGCTVINSGIRLPPYDDNDCEKINYQRRSGDTDKDRSSVILVHADFSVIDHDLYRKLLSIKGGGRSLFVIATDHNIDSVEALLELDCVDGFATIGDVLAGKLEKQSFDDSLKAFRFSSLETGRWYEEIQREWSSIVSKNRVDAWVLFPRDDSTLAAKQRSFLDSNRYIVSSRRLHYRKDAARFIWSVKETGKCVVVVTGCFDLITAAHVRFLKRAKAAGDVLVVGLEDDTRIRAFKSPLRPVNALSQRVELMEAFDFVDFVFVISGSPKWEIKPFYTRLHKTLKADILAVTEGDPHLQDRRAEIEAAGGKLVVVSRLEDGSSTSLIRRFLAETEFSDLLVAPKDNLRGYVAENVTNNQTRWHQLRLPLDHYSQD